MGPFPRLPRQGLHSEHSRGLLVPLASASLAAPAPARRAQLSSDLPPQEAPLPDGALAVRATGQASALGTAGAGASPPHLVTSGLCRAALTWQSCRQT